MESKLLCKVRHWLGAGWKESASDWLSAIPWNAYGQCAGCCKQGIIPVQAEYLPAKGLEQLLQTINKVHRQINPKLQIDGILLTMVDSRTNFAKDIRLDLFVAAVLLRIFILLSFCCCNLLLVSAVWFSVSMFSFVITCGVTCWLSCWCIGIKDDFTLFVSKCGSYIKIIM